MSSAYSQKFGVSETKASQVSSTRFPILELTRCMFFVPLYPSSNAVFPTRFLKCTCILNTFVFAFYTSHSCVTVVTILRFGYFKYSVMRQPRLLDPATLLLWWNPWLPLLLPNCRRAHHYIQSFSFDLCHHQARISDSSLGRQHAHK